MKKSKTAHGFTVVEFYDSDTTLCSIQESAECGEINKPGASYLHIGVAGLRMHVDRKQAKEIARLINQWVRTGEL